MERNRRVAKAYARSPILTLNDACAGFDGHRIGLNGFANPKRDSKVAQIKANGIDQGVKIRMDSEGNLMIKRLSKSDVYVLSFDDYSSQGKRGDFRLQSTSRNSEKGSGTAQRLLLPPPLRSASTFLKIIF